MPKIDEPILVTGGAGFIGSHIVKKLLSNGHETHVLDNFSSGSPKLIKEFENFENFKFYKIDLLDEKSLDFLQNYKTIIHFAANPDVRSSIDDPKANFNQNICATFNLLESIKNTKLKTLIFSSSSTVYGNAKIIPTPEDSPLEPVSHYGASKAACEALICSYAHLFGFNAIIFRFANIVGTNSTHGVINDFIKKLNENPSKLEVLGDGTQCKSFFDVSDCINAFEFALMKSTSQIEFFNVGSEDVVDVHTIAKTVIDQLSLTTTEIEFTGGVDGGRGWKGDVKNMQLDITKLKSLGWRPNHNSLEAIKLATKAILQNRET